MVLKKYRRREKNEENVLTLFMTCFLTWKKNAFYTLCNKCIFIIMIGDEIKINFGIEQKQCRYMYYFMLLGLLVDLWLWLCWQIGYQTQYLGFFSFHKIQNLDARKLLKCACIFLTTHSHNINLLTFEIICYFHNPISILLVLFLIVDWIGKLM